MTLIRPASEEEAAAIVRHASSAGRRFRLEGGGTRAGLGRPVDAEDVLGSAALVGITLHEPAELVISARAGTPVSALVAVLDAHGQRLPFEPADYRALYGTSGEPTVGGLVATAASGPRRVAAGAVRDHLIGIRFVNGRGEVVKSGGRVMKNVTGLDLVKLQCGAHGTLGFLTEATFKVLPTPETTATLAWSGLDDARAVTLLTSALGTPFEVTGAAHEPAVAGRREARTLLRIEGFAESVDYRSEKLRQVLASFGPADRLDPSTADAVWTSIRDLRRFAPPAGDPTADDAVWRLSVPPSDGPRVMARIGALAHDHAYDWGGGLVTLRTPAIADAGATKIRAALAPFGGHATLMRAAEALRRALDTFQPVAAALRVVEARIREGIDPQNVFNPGRMTRAA